MTGSCRFLIVLLALLLGTACVGPKYKTSTHLRFAQWNASLPPEKALGVRVTGQVGDVDRKAFPQLRPERLREMERFHTVELAGDGTPTTRLMLEVHLENVVKVGWAARALQHIPDESYVAISGRVLDLKEDRPLLILANLRAGSGGFMGTGGLMSAGEDRLSRKLMEWVVDDICSELQKGGEQ